MAEGEQDTSTQQEAVVEHEELEQIIEHLSSLEHACDRVREEYNILDASSTQIMLQEYAASLAYVPKIIQALHDFKRFASDYDKRVEQVHKGLRSARKDDRALSSEEERVIASCASIRETLRNSIDGLEYALSHIRSTTPVLLSVIAHNDTDFEEFASDAYDELNLALVHGVAYEEKQRIQHLYRDLLELQSLEKHIEQLQ